jgi:hypothetical protein
MSRNFGGTADYYELSAVPAITPMTFACWAKMPATSGAYQIIGTGHSSTTNSYQYLSVSAGAVFAGSRQNGSATVSTSIAGVPTNTWFHACAVFASTSSRISYLNGTAATENTSASTPVIDRTAIGVRRSGGTLSTYMAGQLAEAAIWTAALTSGEIAALASGVNLRLIRPSSLWAYWPLLGLNSPEPDWSGNIRNITATGAPTAANHAPVSLWVPPCSVTTVGPAGIITADSAAAATAGATSSALVASYGTATAQADTAASKVGLATAYGALAAQPVTAAGTATGVINIAGSLTAAASVGAVHLAVASGLGNKTEAAVATTTTVAAAASTAAVPAALSTAAGTYSGRTTAVADVPGSTTAAATTGGRATALAALTTAAATSAAQSTSGSNAVLTTGAVTAGGTFARAALFPAAVSAASNVSHLGSAIYSFRGAGQEAVTASTLLKAQAVALASLSEFGLASSQQALLVISFIHHVGEMLATLSLAQSMTVTEALSGSMAASDQLTVGMVVTDEPNAHMVATDELEVDMAA